jgi:hypothetical protein
VVRPVPGRPALAVAQGEGRLQVAVGLLSGQDLGDPILHRGLHELLGLEDLLVAACGSTISATQIDSIVL